MYKPQPYFPIFRYQKKKRRKVKQFNIFIPKYFFISTRKLKLYIYFCRHIYSTHSAIHFLYNMPVSVHVMQISTFILSAVYCKIYLGFTFFCWIFLCLSTSHLYIYVHYVYRFFFRFHSNEKKSHFPTSSCHVWVYIYMAQLFRFILFWFMYYICTFDTWKY